MHKYTASHDWKQAFEAGNTSTSSNAVTDVDADDDDVDNDAAGKKRARTVSAGSGSSSSSSSSSSSGAAAAKRAKSDHCMWTGKLQDAKQHFSECVYAGAVCGFGCGAVVRRIDMSEHEASICPKRNVKCSNVGCTAVMPESKVAVHKANECLYELVDCPFLSVGCYELVLRKDIESHEEAAMKQHNRLLLQSVQSLQQDNRLLKQKVAEHEERLDGHLHRIVFKVKLADLVRDGEVDLESDYKMMGAYNARMMVNKGYDDNGNYCGVYLDLEDGPFPCRVSSTFDVLDRNGKPESAYKSKRLCLYDETNVFGLAFGADSFIPMSQLTAAASPYVKDGHVTFIVTFRFLPVE